MHENTLVQQVRDISMIHLSFQAIVRLFLQSWDTNM